LSQTEQTVDLEKVNKLLEQGYRLKSVELRPLYLLELKLKLETNSASWDSIAWNSKQDKPNFAWTFATDKEGKVIPEVAGFVEHLKKGPVKEGQYEYQLSKDGKFLQRIKHSE
jgi:hypothetical protein